ncbi:MAG: hypothetical protein JRN26_04355 [Nitrososphaerota archaeon]|nr:hypothetical protein [Nitrososphaerota archaeon]MDG6936096.1 hypothetical protein [Nitrososphaerota archaeon]MDG6944532.1 hypothetical protein [Nitrososphaerota archaeon]
MFILLLFQPLGIVFVRLHTSPIYSSITLNYLGFVLPLLGSGFFLGLYYKIRAFVSLKQSAALILALAIAAAIPFVPHLPIVLKVGYGSGSNALLWIVVVLWLAWIVNSGNTKAAIYLSYPLGFLVGAVSDITAFIIYGPGYSLFGGLGLLDGDFAIPLALLVSTLITVKIFGRYSKSAERPSAGRVAGNG